MSSSRALPIHGLSCETAVWSNTYDHRAHMTFVLQMAVRETRAAWRRLFFFFICIAVGVAAIVALRSVIQNVRQVFSREAKTLVAADVVINTNRNLTPAAQQLIDRRLEEAQTIVRTETVSTPTMIRPADA